MVLSLLLANFLPAAPASQPTPTAIARAKQLKANLKSFELILNYHGDEDKPYYRLTLSVGPVAKAENNPFFRTAQITQDQAGRIVDLLVTEGFLDRAIDAGNKKIPPPPTPCYTMSVIHHDQAARHEFYDVIGWDLQMLKRLDALRAVLDGDAAQSMDLLLGRMAGHRKIWEKPA
jgi:hypothetical protein